MQLLWANAAALTVALIYYSWRTYHQLRLRRGRVLHERVAYMLWVIATRSDSRSGVVRVPASAN
jgi:hypothetical protein